MTAFERLQYAIAAREELTVIAGLLQEAIERHAALREMMLSADLLVEHGPTLAAYEVLVPTFMRLVERFDALLPPLQEAA